MIVWMYYLLVLFSQNLRVSIIKGDLQANQLVHFTSSQLATDDMKKQRDDSAKESALAKRADLYEITRAAILQDNGIDANKGGEFTCRKCKGTKTTHYALQTRSSDEPMTVFVCCLTCGTRWRCTWASTWWSPPLVVRTSTSYRAIWQYLYF